MADPDEVRSELDAPIPADVIFRKEGKFDYVKGGWVTQEMNRIFGFEGWDMTVEFIDRWETGKKSKTGTPEVAALVKVLVTACGAQREDMAVGTGYGDYHNAVGEAVTDAMKRCCARFGVRTGGMLYLDEHDERRLPAEIQQLLMAIRLAPELQHLELCQPAIRGLKGQQGFKECLLAYKVRSRQLTPDNGEEKR